MSMEIQRLDATPVMNILVTIDEGYIEPFKVLAMSVVLNNPEYRVCFLLMHSRIDSLRISDLHAYCLSLGAQFAALRVDEERLAGIPTTKRYPVAVYYRLLAAHALPPAMKRIIYLDCDMLVINSLRELWEMDLQGKAFAAASHSGDTKTIDRANQLRLGTSHEYFNTGVLLIDIERAREAITPAKLIECATNLGKLLVLPDQDVFNVVCGHSCLAIDDELWNYDVRNFLQYRAASRGEHDLDWHLRNVRILHFCGTRKPWKKSYSGRFGVLYKHYARLASRVPWPSGATPSSWGKPT